MHRIVYTSEAAEGLGQVDLFEIIEQSARNNPSADITGFLIYRGGRFLQLIEGPLMALETLLSALGRDPRHRCIEVVDRQAVLSRSFPRWRMQRVGADRDAMIELTEALREQGGGTHLLWEVHRFLAAPLTA